MPIRVCYVYSDVNYSHLIEATAKFVDAAKYELSFVFVGEKKPALYSILEKNGCAVYFIKFNGRRHLISAINRLRQVFAQIKPEIVHTHLVKASLAGLIAAKLSGIRRRIHTRHHSTECHLYYPHAVYYDKIISSLSQKIVAISDTVYNVLTVREKVPKEKVKLINHGFELNSFKANAVATEEVKTLYALENHFPVIGAISRFVDWKGLQYTIPAFRQLAEKHPSAKLVLANATGPDSTQIKNKLHENLSESQYVLIEFEKRVFDLYKTFDIFVHVPIDYDSEAFGQTYVEALALEVPSVFTLSGVANDFIKDQENALIVPHKNADAIYRAFETLLADSTLRTKIAKQGKADVWSRFGAERMWAELDSLYKSL